MKYIVIILLAVFSLNAVAQTKNKSSKSTSSSQKTKAAAPKTTTDNSGVQNVKDRIEKRLKDSAAANAGVNNSVNSTKTSEQVNGIVVNQANANIDNRVNANANTNVNKSGVPINNHGVVYPNSGQAVPGAILNNNTTNSAAGGPVSNNPIANKPTTNEQSQYNNTDLNRNQVNVINQNQNASAAQNPATKIGNQNTVGETQWGQNQVGENQWTPPNQIITNFSQDFPTVRGATWSRDNALTNFTARYRSGDAWITSTYNSSGIRVDSRTELSLTGKLPVSVTTYKSKQNLPVEFTRISRVERPGKADVYEVRLNNGKLVYLDNNGAEVAF